MRSRREFLGATLTGLAAVAAAPWLTRASAAPKPARTKPRYLVVIQLCGGPDPILTLDPKTRAEVARWVDNPLVKGNVASGGISLGAQFAPLLPWASNMAILRGVRVESVNHFSATWQLVRMRRRVSRTVPGLLDIIARYRDTQPIGALTTGNIGDRLFTPTWVPNGTPTVHGEIPAKQGFDQFEAMDRADTVLLARAMRKHAGDASLRPADREGYTQVAGYLERMPQLTKFVAEDWSVRQPEAGMNQASFTAAATGMQRVLWALENDLVAGAYVSCTVNGWDTHTFNLGRQTTNNSNAVAFLQRFLEQLRVRRNQHGVLADNTTIVVSGELGRYPKLNSARGKDHYPEMPMLFLGAGINPGNVIGQTDKEMLGLPVDPATGKLEGTRHLVLDDVGTTLLRLFDIDPTSYGYGGRPIEPLLA